MLNVVKHLFVDMHSSLIDSSLPLRMTGWFYQNIAIYPCSKNPLSLLPQSFILAP
ncbi:MAG: hypothetical protein JWR38_22 [Mucilaginibacter sp.]|nr:hypothetical protein [Mucilaginibacter sp.]